MTNRVSCYLIDKPKTQKTKPKTQNTKPKTPNPKHKTPNPKHKTQNPKPETQNPKPKTINKQNVVKENKTAKQLDVKEVHLESGIEVNPVYTAEDSENSGIENELPGKYPFTRGIHPGMYRKRPFTIRQYAGFASPEETNERFHFLLKNGQSGLNVAFDLPTQCGLDSDDAKAFGEIGRVGMTVDSLKDFETAFKGIDLDKITVSLTINGSAIIAIAMYFAMAEKAG